MAIELFECYEEEGMPGCCLVSRATIRLGGSPMELTYTVTTPDDARRVDPDQPQARLELSVGTSFRCTRDITRREFDRHDETLKAAEYVTGLEAELSVRAGECRRLEAELSAKTEEFRQLQAHSLLPEVANPPAEPPTPARFLPRLRGRIRRLLSDLGRAGR
ncbi:MAG: hypothetical protein V1748_00490 [Actinomycetota bacterium]